MINKNLLLLMIFTFSWPSYARHTPGIEKFSIFGKTESLPTKPGAAHLIDEHELGKFDYRDVHQVLRSVPGVNIQEEDGFGLRPNIGLRGAHPHRSKKVTIMEDGVLIGPAPYSAPAAYYFPNLETIYNFEIFKGPAAVQYGPNSVGGAINMISRRYGPGTTFNVNYGQFSYQKYQVSSGFKAAGDWSVDLVRSSHGGFKVLPDQQNTGYERHNVFVRYDKELPANQQVTFKVNWANEDSRETYLGLSNDDFNLRPLQRYAASSRDQMNWDHRQIFANYQIEPSENYTFRATAYFHQFHREWDKFDGFFDQTVLPLNVLRAPYLTANSSYYNILRGQQNTTAVDNSDKVRLTNNDRRFLSRGLQLYNQYNLDTDNLGNHEFKVGYRLHADQIARNHVSSFFDMTNGQLTFANLANEDLVQNKHQALAHTVYVDDTVYIGNAQISAGARLENVTYETLNYQSTISGRTSEQAVSPGVGVFYQLYSQGGLLAGVNKGVTLVGPGQSSSVKSEEAMNYELGFRHSGQLGFEAIGFYSDYQNILGTCTLSSGCATADLDRQFNGGRAEIYGVEALVSGEGRLGAVAFPTRLSATYTVAEFRSDFTSGLVDWGIGQVRSGDPLPYIPQIQGQLSTGIQYDKWQSFFNFNYVGAVADQAVSQDRSSVPSYIVINTSLQYQWSKDLHLMLRVDNLLNKRYAVSYRPFGLRPGSPFTALIGLRYEI